ncbi:unnamed protein product [Protopolystoma xenopodis]|uniref:Uncharacterized protein n=1 Tax=Protopolystoma xenopodis TaxID=117903 RepID=A0A448WZY6_9PLAT|nr:unnamed protein product [Protopolystoma xenopodis]
MTHVPTCESARSDSTVVANDLQAERLLVDHPATSSESDFRCIAVEINEERFGRAALYDDAEAEEMTENRDDADENTDEDELCSFYNLEGARVEAFMGLAGLNKVTSSNTSLERFQNATTDPTGGRRSSDQILQRRFAPQGQREGSAGRVNLEWSTPATLQASQAAVTDYSPDVAEPVVSSCVKTNIALGGLTFSR